MFWSRVALQLLCAHDVFISAVSLRSDSEEDDVAILEPGSFAAQFQNALKQINQQHMNAYVGQPIPNRDFLHPKVFEVHEEYQPRPGSGLAVNFQSQTSRSIVGGIQFLNILIKLIQIKN